MERKFKNRGGEGALANTSDKQGGWGGKGGEWVGEGKGGRGGGGKERGKGGSLQ